jgi:alanyl-tRNA synthetase
MLTSNDIRSGFIDFFTERGHQFVPSWPVVPIGDDTLLFTNAGMNQFKDIFLGFRKPPYGRAANSQKCIRVSGKHNDLEEVGLDTYHHTFFEMLGNWSFNDYFKAEAIQWAWDLLTKVYGIKPDLLWATVFAGDKEDGSEPDQEAAALWTKITPMPKERVLFCGRKDNFWEMGSSGPCGPCSEIHIDLGPDRCDMKQVPAHQCKVNGGCARFIELWNLVFIQFNRKPDGSLERLGANYVDTGAGLERIASVLQKKQSNYDTDLFMPLIRAAEGLAGKKYTSQLGSKTDNAFRVIADHIRTLSFAIADGVMPSNEGRGYVMRRILRRASRFGRTLDLHEPFLHKLVAVLADNMGKAFAELSERREFVARVIESEEASFGRTLDRGLEIFAAAAERAMNTGEKIISGEDAFKLYDTYGFPLDLTQLMAREQGLKVDTDGFDRLMDQQRQQARAAQKTGSLTAFLGGMQLPQTDDLLKYQTDSCTARVIGWIDRQGLHTEGQIRQTAEPVGLVLDRTCFYAESGGQVGDSGQIHGQAGSFTVETTEKAADCVIHQGKIQAGSLRTGDEVTALVDPGRRQSRKNHTVTHLLQWALRKVLGDSVKQQGSLVCPEYFRFDFTWPKALTRDQIRQIEMLVQSRINEDHPVTTAVLPIEEAKKLGAMALFGEKYGEHVRVIAIGAPSPKALGEAFSKEFCGGTHVERTGLIGGFAIVKEESISSGVRRITGLTGQGLMEHLMGRSRIVDELVEMLKTPADQITVRVNKLLEDNKNLQKQLKTAARGGGTDTLGEVHALLDKARRFGQSAVVIGQISTTSAEQTRTAIDSVKKKAGSAVVVLGMTEEDGKVTLLAGVTDDLIKKGIKAGDIVKEIAPIVGGGGGGRPQMAQAGGKDPSKIAEALEKAAESIAQKLG